MTTFARGRVLVAGLALLGSVSALSCSSATETVRSAEARPSETQAEPVTTDEPSAGGEAFQEAVGSLPVVSSGDWGAPTLDELMNGSVALVVGKVSSIDRAPNFVESMEMECEEANGKASQENQQPLCKVQFSTAVAKLTLTSTHSIEGAPVAETLTIPLALGPANTSEQIAEVDAALKALQSARPTSDVAVFVSQTVSPNFDFDLGHMAGWATVESDGSLLNLGALAVPGAKGIAGIRTLQELEAAVARD